MLCRSVNGRRAGARDWPPKETGSLERHTATTHVILRSDRLFPQSRIGGLAGRLHQGVEPFRLAAVRMGRLLDRDVSRIRMPRLRPTSRSRVLPSRAAAPFLSSLPQPLLLEGRKKIAQRECSSYPCKSCSNICGKVLACASMDVAD